VREAETETQGAGSIQLVVRDRQAPTTDAARIVLNADARSGIEAWGNGLKDIAAGV
jgi:hypothetical protein